MGPEFVGVFEDDLMMTGSADKVKRAVGDAVQVLPTGSNSSY